MSSKTIHCAIYTRKSSEEGLEQDFNSLNAQREACAAYVASQASEGWKLLPKLYDDGGISGGTLERPALQRLLADVRTGQIDIIVVYKVDRLTRSLLDFAKLVEAFDKAGVSFVSVTQSFNTTTSMGRLTLNMLLSFAQFEREVTAERIRDKIAQSKARGMWMGGTPPLGYEPDGKNGLTIVEDHAALIRDIYARYLKLGNVRLLAGQLEREGIRTPLRSRKNGSTFGNCLFARGQLYQILKNPTYAGNIPHKGKVYPGNHKAIIGQKTWDRVQQKLSDHVQGTRQVRESSKALLAGKLFDRDGEALIPVHASKQAGTSDGRKRYAYYVSRAVHHMTANQTSPALRIPAREIEQAVCKQLAALFGDPYALIEQAKLDVTLAEFEVTASKIGATHHRISGGAKSLVRKLLKQVTVGTEGLELIVDTQALADHLYVGSEEEAPNELRHTCHIRLTRTGHALKLIDERGCAMSAVPNASLTSLLVQARKWWKQLSQGHVDIAKLSRREGVTASWMTRVVRLSFLAPDVTDAILRGKARADLDTRDLLAAGTVTADWDTQSAKLLPASL